MSQVDFTYSSKAEYVAQKLLARIAESDLKPGQTLATEAELLEQFAVSRPTLRESLRILEFQEIVQLKPGPGGGILVNRPGIGTLAHSLSIFLRLHGIPFIMVLRAREAIEPALASEAARNGTDAQFDALAASIDRMKAIRDDDDAFFAENRVFHGLVAEASGNKVLSTFWDAISILASGEQHSIQYSATNRAHIIRAHQNILRTCRARDAEAAGKAMAAHVGELEQLIRKRYRYLLEEPTRVTARSVGI